MAIVFFIPRARTSLGSAVKKTLNVPVSALFFKDKKATITHEYQFDYQTKEAKQCYQETVQFVNTYK